MDVIERTVEYYRTPEGKIPFREWLNSLKDVKIQQIIDSRLARLRSGLLGSRASVGNGVYELKIHFGSGYRIYFGEVGNKIVLLLWGGVKKSQPQDITKAKGYWNDYRGTNK